jgi:hypothetical protein
MRKLACVLVLACCACVTVQRPVPTEAARPVIGTGRYIKIDQCVAPVHPGAWCEVLEADPCTIHCVVDNVDDFGADLPECSVESCRSILNNACRVMSPIHLSLGASPGPGANIAQCEPGSYTVGAKTGGGTGECGCRCMSPHIFTISIQCDEQPMGGPPNPVAT